MRLWSTYELKAGFSRVLFPIISGLARIGVTANQVTLAALSLSVGYGVAMYLTELPLLFGLLAPFLLVRMALNNIDGVLARQFNQKSKLGGFLNELGDVFSDAALYLPFAVIAGVYAPIVVAFALLAIAGEFAGVLAQTVGKDRCYAGPLTKSDRALAMAVLGILIAFGFTNPIFLNIVLSTLTIAAGITLVRRIKLGTKEVA